MSRLRGNIFSVGALQIVIYMVNFAALPYLTRVLGVNEFGNYALTIAVSQYAVVVTNWGFWGNAVRKISRERCDQEYINKLFSATWYAQWLIFMVLLIVSLVLVYSLNCFGIYFDIRLVLVGAIIVAGSILLPSWLLQGLELFKMLSISQIAARLIALPLYFLFVKSSADLYGAVLVTAFAGWISGLSCLLLVFLRGFVKLKLVTLSSIFFELRDGAELLLSQIWIAFYVTLIPVFLGYTSGASEVALFNLADKFKTAGTSLMTPISQALFPRMTDLLNTDKKAAYKLFKYSSLILIFIAVVGGLGMFFLADWIVYLFGGPDYQSSGILLKMMAPLPLIIILASIISTQIMLPMGNKRTYTATYCIAGVISLLFMWPLMSKFGAVGAVLTMGLVESIVTILMAIYFFRFGYKVFK